MEALKIDHLRKMYSPLVGVHDVSMIVKTGTLHGFLGVNGAGKTTTMKCIMSLLRKDSGSIMVFGKELTYEDPLTKLKIGFSPELPAYPPFFTGKEILVTYGKMRGLSSKTGGDEATRILNLLELEEAGNRKVGKYSRGMLARLGVGTAMLGEPELLILDEPTSGLDPVAAEGLRKVLVNIAKQGGTILLSSHQLHDVQKVCTALTIIDKGRDLVEGETEKLLKRSQFAGTFTAEFSRLDKSILDEVGKLENVDNVKVSSENPNTISIKVAGTRDIRVDLASIAIRNNSMLLTCNEEKTDLESLFLSMVGSSHQNSNGE